jgi:prephenate dehydratase
VTPRVAYQGAPGAFGEAAVQQYWGGRAVAVGVETFADVICSIVRGDTRYAVLPAWNSTIGRIQTAWAALEPHLPNGSQQILIAGELTIPISHQMMGRPGVDASSIRLVTGHPAALAQCSRFIHERGLSAIESLDSAGAARWLSSGEGEQSCRVPGTDVVVDLRETAVIAPAAAAERYGMTVLASQVQNEADNRTSFLILESAHSEEGGRW